MMSCKADASCATNYSGRGLTLPLYLYDCYKSLIFPNLTLNIPRVINNGEGQEFFTFDDGPTGRYQLRR